MREATEFADLHFVCVGTPQKKGEFAADVSFVDAAFTELAETLREGAVVVGKSTVPAGTASRLAPLIADGRRRTGVEPGVPPRGARRRRHAAP